MDNNSNEMLAYRDIQTIKISLEHFTKDLVNQLNLLREVIEHDTSEKRDNRKNIQEIEEVLKGLERTLKGRDKVFDSYTKTLNSLEVRLIDKNNQESLAVSMVEVKRLTASTKTLIEETKLAMLSKDSVVSIKESIKSIEKVVAEMKDTKKNLSWWVDWIYKILLTVALIANFFL